MSDPRQTPVTDRVVAPWLAAAYPDRNPVQPEPCYVTAPVLDLRLNPTGGRDRQLLYGDPFDVLERRHGQAFGIASSSDYVGWVDDSALAPKNNRNTAQARVLVRQTHAYTQPDFKSPERTALAHLSRVSTGKQEGRFTETEVGWIPTVHIGDNPAGDEIDTAELYLGSPYLWGGNSCFGIDCSGLVKNALLATDRKCPGDSDLQMAGLGTDLPKDTPLRRGDLLFWKGHVALVANADTLIHANAFHMAVAYEPIQNAINRIEAQGDGPVIARKRLGGPS